MGKQALDRKLEALESLRSAPDSASTIEQLRKALKDRNNYFVSKAAALAGELGLQTLLPDLLAAFDRFLIDAVKSDPRCWAKNAILKALKDLGHDDPAVFLRGMAHFQLEPAFIRPEDTAVKLRGECALALASCPLDRGKILTPLVDLLLDPEKPVRIDAVRAVAQLPGWDSTLLLRLKALTGDKAPEVTGQCFVNLLDTSPRDYVPFVARFLEAADPDVRIEAIAALGESNELDAVEILRAHWNQSRDPEMKRAILLSLGASRQPAAAEFLLEALEEGSLEEAAASITALAAGRFRKDVREKVAAAVAHRDDAKLSAAFEKEFRL